MRGSIPRSPALAPCAEQGQHPNGSVLQTLSQKSKQPDDTAGQDTHTCLSAQRWTSTWNSIDTWECQSLGQGHSRHGGPRPRPLKHHRHQDSAWSGEGGRPALQPLTPGWRARILQDHSVAKK